MINSPTSAPACAPNSFDECRECVAAFTHALRGHPQPPDNQGPLRPSQDTDPVQYLDSAELRSWLGHYHASTGSARSTRRYLPRSALYVLTAGDTMRRGRWQGSPNVVTVYLFDLQRDSRLVRLSAVCSAPLCVAATSALTPAPAQLLDRQWQAASFDDMVVAVQTGRPGALRQFACEDEEDREASHGRGGLGAEVMAALLRTVWGVAPTHSTWSVLHNRTRTEPSRPVWPQRPRNGRDRKLRAATTVDAC